MRCAVCRVGRTRAASCSVTLERDGVTLVFREVPGEVCQNCGEEYVDYDTTVRLFRAAERRGRFTLRDDRVDIRDYADATSLA